MTDLKIIQGDDKHIKVNFTGDGATQIQGFYFSSNKLGISKYFGEQVDGSWIIDLTSEETTQFPSGVANFDITVKTLDGKTITSIYEGTLCVAEKTNKID